MSKIFVVGNGVSLKKTNLDLLIGKDCIATNKIHKIYPTTEWRPTHYVKIEFSANDPEPWRDEVLPHVQNGEKCLLWTAFRAGAASGDGNREFIFDGIGDFDNVQYIERCEHHYQRTVGWHPICTGLNSIVSMVIWTCELGYDEIILVGCDGHYSDPQKDHFTKDYYKTWDAEYVERNNTNIVKAHDFLAANCPIPILDATVDGYLTQYPKVKLENYV